MQDKLFGVGRLGSTRGVKGELKYHSMDNLSFLAGEKVILKDVDVYTLYEVEKAGDYLKLKGIDNPEDAKMLTNHTIYIRRDDLFEYEMLKGELIDMEVISNGMSLGRVKGLMENPAYEIIDVSGKENYSIPFIDEFIMGIERENKKIQVKIDPQEFISH